VGIIFFEGQPFQLQQLVKKKKLVLVYCGV
jgi:hypothetical protein